MATWDYVLLDNPGGAPARTRLIEHLGRIAGGDEVLGLFVPQLGWQASEAAVLVERAEGSDGATARVIAQAPGVTHLAARVMRATARPTDGARPAPGGIWVHRTFETRASDLESFVALSAEAWPDFESRFDARVFGLFEVVEPRPDADVVELLLITRYASHGVWEESRDPTTSAMQTFARRAALTLRTRAASTLLVPVSGAGAG
jgi:hypothetical protein